jgi:hypothetical protein
VHHNTELALYFKNKSKDPYALLEKLIENHEKHHSGETSVNPAPQYHINFSKYDQILRINCIENDKQQSQEKSQPLSDINLLLNSLGQGNAQTTTTGGGAMNQPQLSDINSILLYNIAALSY